jgi:hypothetical protein
MGGNNLLEDRNSGRSKKEGGGEEGEGGLSNWEEE